MVELSLKKGMENRLSGAVPSIKTVLNYISVFIVFSGGWTFFILDFADLRASYFVMMFIMLAWLPFLRHIYFHKGFMLLFFIICLASLYNIIIGNDTPDLFMKQFIGILLNSFFFYALIKINGYDIKRLFKIYLNLAFIVALIGVLQEASYLLGFRTGYDFKHFIPYWNLVMNNTFGLPRLNSILPEPSYFCGVMMPAFFVSVVSFLKNNFGFQKKWKSVIIIVSFFFTFSAVGYIGIFFSLALLAYSYRKTHYFIVVGLIIAALGVLGYRNIPDFRIRIDHSVGIMKGDIRLETVDSSTFAFYTNARVASRNFLDNPVFGTGLGSHKISYYRLIERCINIDEIIGMSFLNVADASSLFLRLLSETGLVGVLVFLAFLLRFNVKRAQGAGNYLWIINNAVLAMFFVKLLKIGHYFIDGFFFFLWLYYFSKIQFDNIKRSSGPDGK